MSAIDRNSYKYKQNKPCITTITKTDIKRIFFRGTIGGGLACVDWVCRGGAGPRGAVSAASSTGGFVAVHRPTWVGTTGWSVLAWLIREPAASTLQYSL